MVLIFMCDALYQTRGSVHADELATACTAPKPLAALLKTLDDTASPSCIATLGLLQRLHAVPAVAPRLRALLSSAANAIGVPRGALRIASARLDDADRGIAPTVPRLETHAGFQAPRTPAATAADRRCSGVAADTPHSAACASTLASSGRAVADGAVTFVGARLPTTPGDTMAGASQLPPPPTASRAQQAPKTPRGHSQLPQPRTPHQATCDGGFPGHLATTARPARKSLGGGKGIHGDSDVFGRLEPVRVGSDELSREVREAARTLKLPLRAEGTWEQRAAAMRRLEALLLGGCARHAQCAHLFNSLLREPLGLQLADLRSKCVKQACLVICEAARQMGGAYLESAEHLLPQLLKLAQVTIHVITEAADACVCTLLREVRARSLLPPILHGAIGREGSAASLRAGCTRYIELAISEFDTATLAADMTQLELALRHTLQDASSDVRAGARAAFAAFERHWPARAAGLKGLLQASSQKSLLSSPARAMSAAAPASNASRADRPWKNKSKKFVQDEVQVFAPPRPPPQPAEAPSPPPPQKTCEVVAAGEGVPVRQAWAGSASPTYRPARPLGERGLSANASAGQPRVASRSCDGAVGAHDTDTDGQHASLRLPASAGERAGPGEDEMFAEEYADGYADEYGEEEGAAEGDEHAFDDDDDEHRGEEEYLEGYDDAPQEESWTGDAEQDDAVGDGDGEEGKQEQEYDEEDDGGGGFDTSLPPEGAWAMLPGEAHWAGEQGEEDNPLSPGSEAEWLRGYNDDGDGGADGGGYEEAEQPEGDGADVLGRTVRPSHAPAEDVAPAVQPARQPKHRSAPASPAASLASPPSQSPAPAAADWPQQSPRRGRPPQAQPPPQRPSPSPRKPVAPPSPAAAATASDESSQQVAEALRRARHESSAAREEAAAAQEAAHHAEARAAAVERRRATAEEECAALRRRLQQAEARHKQSEAERRYEGDEAARALEEALERLHAAEQRAASAEQRAASAEQRAASVSAAAAAASAGMSASASRAASAEEARLDAARATLAARELELEQREADAQAAQRQAAKRLADGRNAEQASTERVAEAARFAAELRERELELHRREQALASSQASLHKRELALQAAQATRAAHASTPHHVDGATSSVAKPPAARPTPRSVPPFAVTPSALEPAYDGTAARTALSPLPLSLAPEAEPPGDISELLAACNAYVDNIVSENQRMRSKLLSCRSKMSGPTHASD